MKSTVYKSKVDWWVYVLLIITTGGCLSIILWDDYFTGIILAVSMGTLWVFCFMGMKYEIKGNQLGVRSMYRWTWVPINKISEVKKIRSILAGPAASIDRVSIKFSDRSVLKSSMPIEISPKNRDCFIAQLKEINPEIIVKS